MPSAWCPFPEANLALGRVFCMLFYDKIEKETAIGYYSCCYRFKGLEFL